MGALKGHFQCLCGLHVQINSNQDHIAACQWITIAIILHNLVINVEGGSSAGCFESIHGRVEEQEDRALADDPENHNANGDDEEEGKAKWSQLMSQLLAYKEMIESV
jgi:hypothetical protein